MENYLNPMLEAGMLAMTEPETPTSRNQKYKAVDKINATPVSDIEKLQ